MRKREVFVRKYGEEIGGRYYHLLQSQAAHAGVSARLRRKIDGLSGEGRPGPRPEAALPLFPEATADDRPDAVATASA